ncbi:fimbria/pilus outer membrane usher protein [Serratia marcescens]|uniref:fimbria/pilus outer membrane usher protein n=1 Tax=Serratia marcescens TaxID=615 RepID=UPI0039832D52
MVNTNGRAAMLTASVLSACLSGLWSGASEAEELWFPPELIATSGELADLSQLSQGLQLPGTYRVNLIVNGENMGSRDVRFVKADQEKLRMGVKDNTGLVACFVRADLDDIGVRPEAYAANASGALEGVGACVSPGAVIEQSTTNFDFQKMLLEITIPQIWVRKRPRGWVSPERWDDGISAGLLGYSLSGADSRGRYGHTQNYYLRLNSGLNIGPWRLRDERAMSAWSGSSHSREWRRGQTWLERGIRPWSSRLRLGDGTTPGEIFESTAFRGIQLMTDDNMYPESMRGYAPVIRGTAQSNAQLSIRQNGYVVYQANVAPGPFAIDDIYPMYSSGDLQVTVREADGTARSFTVPYATVPSLLREGRLAYALSAGRLQGYASNDSRTPIFIQSTLTWGLPWGVTTYGGVQMSDRYQSVALGAGINMGTWGAFSTDVTNADSALTDGSRHKGQSLRFLYSRSFNTTGTTLQLAGYRYSTEGFYTLEESSRKRMAGWSQEQERDANGRLIPRPVTDWYDLRNNRRERMEVSISQRMGDSSSVYFTGAREAFWGNGGANTSIRAGFSSTFRTINYSLGYNESRSASMNRTDRGIFISLSLPLDVLLPGGHSSRYFNASMNSGYDGVTQQAGVSGSELAQNNLDWSLSQGYSRVSGNNASARVAWRGTYGNVSGGYSQGQNYHQFSYDLSGGVIVHGQGVTFGQPLGSTNVLVVAPGAKNVPIENGTGVSTDWRGYAIQPWASEYHDNRVALDVSRLDDRTELDQPVVRVTPTQGAVVRADFKVRTGLRALITLVRKGKPLPFGATVSAGSSSGIVGENGQVYLSGLPEKGDLSAKWGNGEEQKCRATWSVNISAPSTPLDKIIADCQ